MTTTVACPRSGLAFDVPDLHLAQAWANFHRLRMIVYIDRVTGPDDADEVLGFTVRDGAPPLWHLWRDEDAICVQPAIGRTVRFARLVDALDSLIPEQPLELTASAGLPPR
jgi:hypothetical protein